MALLIPAMNGQAVQRNYSGRPTSTWGTTLTGSATPHALPASPTQVISSTTYEAEWIQFSFTGMHQSATITDGLCNIYIGGAGSETLFIDSLQCGWTATHPLMAPISYWFPVRVARGTRISASLRNLIASDSVYLTVELGVSNGSHWVGSGVETLGETTASSRGTAVTPGSTSEGSATLIGTTGRRYRYVRPSMMGNNDITAIGAWIAYDITDSGGTIIQGLENWTASIASTEICGVGFSGGDGFWCDIPASTALYLRGQAHTTASGLSYCTIHGVY